MKNKIILNTILSLILMCHASFIYIDSDKISNLISNPSFSKCKKCTEKWFNPDSSRERTPNFLSKDKKDEFLESHYGKVSGDVENCVGIIAYTHTGTKRGYSEFISNELSEPVIKGKAYSFNLSYTLGHHKGRMGFSEYSLKGMGIYLTEEKPSLEAINLNEGSVAIFEDHWGSYCDWENVTLEFVPDKNYRYITVGFFPNIDSVETKGYEDFEVKKINLESNLQTSSGWTYYFMKDFNLFEVQDSMIQRDLVVFPNTVINLPNDPKGAGAGKKDNSNKEEKEEKSPASGKELVENLSSKTFSIFFKEDSVDEYQNERSTFKEMDDFAESYNKYKSDISKVIVRGYSENKINCDSKADFSELTLDSLAINRAKRTADSLSQKYNIPISKLLVKTGVPAATESEKKQKRVEISFMLTEEALKKSIDLFKGDWISFDKNIQIDDAQGKLTLPRGRTVQFREYLKKDSVSIEIKVRRYYEENSSTIATINLEEGNPPIVTYRRLIYPCLIHLREGIQIYSDKEGKYEIKESLPFEEVKVVFVDTPNKEHHDKSFQDTNDMEYGLLKIEFTHRCSGTIGYVMNIKPEDFSQH